MKEATFQAACCTVGKMEMEKSSSHDQFADLLLRYHGQIFGYIFAAVQNLNDAEDVYQETCLVLWSKFSDYQPGSNFVRWACKTAKYKVLHFQHDKYRGPLCFSETVLSNLVEVYASIDSDTSQRHQEFLAECVDQLSLPDQQLVEFCYSGQDSMKHIAEKLRRSPQTLYNSLSRIRRLLFDCIHLKSESENHG